MWNLAGLSNSLQPLVAQKHKRAITFQVIGGLEKMLSNIKVTASSSLRLTRCSGSARIA